MQVEHYYYIKFDEQLYSKLIDEGIKVKVDSDPHYIAMFGKKMAFNIYESIGEKSCLLDELLAKFGDGLTDYVFSKRELVEAKWLLFRSTNMKLDPLSEKTIEYSCPKSEFSYYHTKQVAPYAFKPIKWKSNNHFYSALGSYYTDIFCDDYAKELLEKENFNGLSFEEVLWANKNIPLPNSHQLVFNNILPINSVLNLHNTVPINCPLCKKTKYNFDGNLLYRIEVDSSYLDDSYDFYKTGNDFTNGLCDFPFLICSQRVYSFLTSMNLTRNLCFEPLIVK